MRGGILGTFAANLSIGWSRVPKHVVGLKNPDLTPCRDCFFQSPLRLEVDVCIHFFLLSVEDLEQGSVLAVEHSIGRVGGLGYRVRRIVEAKVSQQFQIGQQSRLFAPTIGFEK
jgi:hypothetical protein